MPATIHLAPTFVKVIISATFVKVIIARISVDGFVYTHLYNSEELRNIRVEAANIEHDGLPYPNKCYLPFILYPPAMHRVEDGNNFALRNLRLHEEGNDFIPYLSIPFCRVRCKACPYYIDVLPKNDHKGEEDAYIDALLKDIRHWASFPKWNTGRLRAVYLGGGTGSILMTANLKGIVDTVFGSFRAADDCCFTLEGNARDFDDEKLDYVANSR